MSSNIKIKRICLNCGNEFIAKTTVTKFCSTKCASKDYKRRQREKKINKSQQETQEIITQVTQELKTKSFLSIKEVCILTGVSRTTLWRMELSNLLVPGKFNGRKIYKREDIDQIFNSNADDNEAHITNEEPRDINSYSLDELYSLSQVYKLYNVKPDGLYKILKRNSVPKKRVGKEVFVPMEDIIRLFDN